jgi:hypothetical protein
MNKFLALIVVILSLLVLLLGGYIAADQLGLWGAADKPSATAPKAPATPTTPNPTTPDPTTPDPTTPNPTTPDPTTPDPTTPDPTTPTTPAPTEPVEIELPPWPGTAATPFGAGVVFTRPNLQFKFVRVNYTGLNAALATMVIEMQLIESEPDLGAWWKRGVVLYYSVDGQNQTANPWPIEPQVTQKGNTISFTFARVPVEALYVNPSRGAVGLSATYSPQVEDSLAFAIYPPDRQIEKKEWDKAQKEAAKNAPAVAPIPTTTPPPVKKAPVKKAPVKKAPVKKAPVRKK